MSTHQTNSLLVHAIDSARLDIVRTTGAEVTATNSVRSPPPAKASRCVVAFATPSQASRSR